jgi:DNA invertase Pin-like site-specific DNA recombinase
VKRSSITTLAGNAPYGIKRKANRFVSQQQLTRRKTMQDPTNQTNIAKIATSQVAIYARNKPALVSTPQGSHRQQLHMLLAYAQKLGWEKDTIRIFLDSPGRSRTGVQPALDKLLQAIIQDQIKAILVESATELFRNVTAANTFLHHCHEHGVMMLTPYDRYDLSDARDVALFQIRYEPREAFLNFARTRFQRAKEAAALRGLYDGRPILPGFIVDRRRFMNGEENPTYKKLIPYEPHATIIRTTFCLYVEYRGDIEKMHAHAPVQFPDFDEHVDPVSRAKTMLLKGPEGYILPLEALWHLLRNPNPTYIGTWVYKGQMLVHNHIPIVPDDIFRQAQALSPKRQSEDVQRD